MRLFRRLSFVYTIVLTSSLVLANFSPPPPSISNINLLEGRVRIPEWEWTKDTSVEVVGTAWPANRRVVKGIWMDAKNSSCIRLTRGALIVGTEGVNALGKRDVYIKEGFITSSSPNLVVRSAITHEARLIIDAIISDNGRQKVGLFVSNINRNGLAGVVSLDGWNSNTFTGDVTIEGKGATLFMNKLPKVISVRSNIYVRNGGRAAVAQSDQIADTSTVTLVGNNSALSFAGTMLPTTEKIHKLVVQSGNGILNFQRHTDVRDRAQRLFYFDDIIINNGASLTVLGWETGRDYFLVRKNSPHLKDALKKLMIHGWGKNQVYLKSYDKDYWSIEAAPEPSTYGALFGALGLGLVARRKRSY